jgi:hypothetical protein
MSDILDETNTYDDVQFHGYEVTELIDSIRSASSYENSVHGSSVFDSSAMSPLSPASAVSKPQLRFPSNNTRDLRLIMNEDSTRPITGIFSSSI